MKLAKGEQSILASFTQGPEAKAASLELQQAGYGEVQVDRVGAWGFDPGKEQGRVGFGGQTSQAEVTLFDEPPGIDEDRRVLLAAMPEASGMAGAPIDLMPPFLVTVVTTEDLVPDAVAIIKRHGGRV